MQYYGWALKNRAALMPTREQVERAAAEVEELRAQHHGRIVIDAVVPDYHARFPKPCVGGWGRRSLNVTPSGRVLPCHAAESIPGLEFWNVRDRSLADIWAAVAGLQRLPRHGLPARALRQLRAARDRFRRLPLPGLPVDRRCAGDRSGLPPVAASCPRGRACRGARGSGLRLPAHVMPASGRSQTAGIRLRAGGQLSDTVAQGRPAVPSPWRNAVDASGSGLPHQGGVYVHFNVVSTWFAARRKPCPSDRRVWRRIRPSRRRHRRSAAGFSPMDQTKPSRRASRTPEPQAEFPTPPIATPLDKLPGRQDQAAGRLQGRSLVARPSGRAHHGDGRQGHDVHGHARDRPRLCHHRQGRQARGQDAAVRD